MKYKENKNMEIICKSRQTVCIGKRDETTQQPLLYGPRQLKKNIGFYL